MSRDMSMPSAQVEVFPSLGVMVLSYGLTLAGYYLVRAMS
jgi:hypothetical protein